jgi:hypothetical protein
VPRSADAILAALSRSGLLLKQDKDLPSVVGLMTGESLKTSWWSHPRAHAIFAELERLADHRDVLFVKLLFAKDTLVHRRLWPALLAVGAAREPWQVRGLSAAARRLLDEVDESAGPVRAHGPAVRELEKRLLAHTEEIHTESGRHEMTLEPWARWARRVGCRRERSLPQAYEALEEAARDLGAPPKALAWPAPRLR